MENRKVTEAEIMADDMYDIQKAINESGDMSDWSEVETAPVLDYEIESEADRIHEDVCPCSFGICDEEGGCPLCSDC